MYYIREQIGRKVRYFRWDAGVTTPATKAAFDALPRDYDADRRTGGGVSLSYTVEVHPATAKR